MNAFTPQNKMVKHIVTFKLKGTPETRLIHACKFRDALLALPTQIDCLKGIEVGINSNPDEDWDIVLTATLPDMASVNTYATHPAHVAAASIIKDVRDMRACVDYEV